ncbi:ATP-binding protein [Candidatus Peregrinibacteria bacterium]|nr:ATP-binding protein [Candidatus Peregrinibacteria bacterium]
MKYRTLAQTIYRATKTFPAVVVTGPRQSGKTTLLKMLFKKTHRFVSLEDPETRMRAKEDPVGFLENYGSPVMLDEIQYAPELLSYIKTRIDQKRKPGTWLFTGSQNFVLMQGISQSLAGRAAVLSLLPFSYAERINKGKESRSVENWIKKFSKAPSKINYPSLNEFMLRGNFPEIASKKNVDRKLWCSSYIATYLERDVRMLAQIGDLSQFERFLKLCATRTGQLLDVSGMARDVGVSVTTAKRWLSILEASYQIYLLPPYYKNIGKRLVKRPKLYFNDTALASYLLGIHEKETLLQSSHFGNLFETMVVTDILKRFLHAGDMPSMYFLRTRDGLEIDLALEINQLLYLFEIKSSMTITSQHATSLIRLKKEQPKLVRAAAIISQTKESYSIAKGIMNYSYRDALCI